MACETGTWRSVRDAEDNGCTVSVLRCDGCNEWMVIMTSYGPWEQHSWTGVAADFNTAVMKAFTMRLEAKRQIIDAVAV